MGAKDQGTVAVDRAGSGAGRAVAAEQADINACCSSSDSRSRIMVSSVDHTPFWSGPAKAEPVDDWVRLIHAWHLRAHSRLTTSIPVPQETDYPDIQTASSSNARLWNAAYFQCLPRFALRTPPSPPALTSTLIPAHSNLTSQTSYSILPSSSSSRLPPPLALASGPALTILKRPSSCPTSASSSRSNSASPAPQKPKERTLVEREQAYEEARRRIYGDSPQTSPSDKDGGGLSSGMAGLALGAPGSGSGSRARSGSSTAGNGRKDGGRGSRPGTPRGGGAVASPAPPAPEGAVRAPRGPTAGTGFGFSKEGGSEGAQKPASGASDGRSGGPKRTGSGRTRSRAR